MGQRQTRTLSEAEHRAMLKNMLLASLISADNDEYSEDTKQEIISRYNKYKDEDVWDYILTPLSGEGVSQETIDEYVRILRG